LLIVVASSAFAQTSTPLSEDDPAVWQARAVRAKTLREESSSMRREADGQRAKDDIACRKKFLENACKDSARERWIEKINKVRALEIEAVGLERNQRAHETAIREKERADNPPRLPLILPPGSEPAAEAQSAAAATPPTKPSTQSRGKSANPPKRTTPQSESAQDRQKKAQEAATRAEQAKKDAARYEARAKEHAQKKAERQAKQSSSAASAAVPAK
jgi:hypothetical protein